MISFTLPAPPSTNQLYSGRRYKTAAYKNWIETAGWELRLQHIQPITGPFALTVYLPGHCDLDNLKAIPDLLVSMGIVKDDRRKFMKKVVVVPTEHVNGSCQVEIEPL